MTTRRPAHLRRTPSALLAGLILLGGCAPERAASPKAAPASTILPPAPPVAPPLLAVDAEGLRLVNPDSGATRPLSFGAPQAQVLGVLERLRGPAGQGENQECRFRYANWTDGLSLNFRDDSFIGWSLDSRAAGALTTMSGIGSGSTRRELLAVYDARIRQTSLGVEFNAGDMAGLLDGAGPDARITDLWAGETCIAR